jgi:DNA processing protein
MCVTGARDVLEHLEPGCRGEDGEQPSGPRRGPAVDTDRHDPVARAVLEQVPVRGGRGPASIAIQAGVDLGTAVRTLGLLAAAGFVQRCERGWRVVRAE